MGIGKLASMFKSIGLIETITHFTCNTSPASHVNKSKQINGVWVSSDLAISKASFCPHHLDVGDHRVIMVCFEKNILLGSDYLPTAPIPMRRLASSNSRAVQLYLSEAKTKIDDHKIVPKINKNLVL